MRVDYRPLGSSRNRQLDVIPDGHIRVIKSERDSALVRKPLDDGFGNYGGETPPPVRAKRSAGQDKAKHSAAPSIDGRTARATGRREQFATRVSPEFHREFKAYAAKHGLHINEALEAAFAAWKRERGE